MKYIAVILLIVIALSFSSCCAFIKVEHLGNNLYLSEYDNVDRRILYTEEKCSGSEVQIVPMTILEIAYDSQWIIAKSGSKNKPSTFKYWIIKNNYKISPKADTIKSNTLGPMDYKTFMEEIKNNDIRLTLKEIE